MQIHHTKTTLCAAALALALPLSAADKPADQSSAQGASSGDQQYQSGSGKSMASSQKTTRQCSVNKLLEADVQSRDGQDLGGVEDVIINPQTGRIDFIALAQDEVTGEGDARVLVPWQAVKMQADGTLRVNQNKSKLQSAPTIEEGYAQLNQQGYTESVYRFYAVPTGAGGADSPGGKSQGTWGSSESTHSSTHTNR